MEEKFSAVLVAGLAVFALVFVLDNVGLADGPEQQVIMQRSPSDVGDTSEDFRSVRFGEFTVGEARGDIQVYDSDREELKDVTFGSSSINIEYEAVQPTGGMIEFEVLGKRGSGTVYAKVNGEKIFEEYLVGTGTPEIEIPQNVLRNGNNKIRIGTSSDFLKESVYTIEDVDVRVNDRKFHDYKDTFQIYSHELKNFVSADMSFSLPVDSSIPAEPLKVYVNDNLLFNRTITRSTQEIEVTSQNSDLNIGENTVKFETDGQAKYSLRNAGMNIRYLGDIRPGSFEESFEVSESRLRYADRERTTESIKFNYVPLRSVQPIEVELNDFNTTVNPERGSNTVQIPEGTLQEDNTFSMKSSSPFRLVEFEMVSERG